MKRSQQLKRTNWNRKSKGDPGPACGKCDPDRGTYNACRGCRAEWGPVETKTGTGKPRRPMANRSAKGRAIDAAYTAARRPFLLDHRLCEIRYSGDRQHRPCSEIATQVHHVVDRGKAQWLIADPRNFAATCEECHEAVTHIDIPWSKANGFYLRAFRFPEYSLRQTTSDGSIVVDLDQADELLLPEVGGERIWLESQVVAWAAGLITTEDLLVRRPIIEMRNGNVGDIRIANLKVRYRAGQK